MIEIRFSIFRRAKNLNTKDKKIINPALQTEN